MTVIGPGVTSPKVTVCSRSESNNSKSNRWRAGETRGIVCLHTITDPSHANQESFRIVRIGHPELVSEKNQLAIYLQPKSL